MSGAHFHCSPGPLDSLLQLTLRGIRVGAQEVVELGILDHGSVDARGTIAAALACLCFSLLQYQTDRM